MQVLRAAFLLFFGLASFGWEAARARVLTFDERVVAQRAIEEVYWRHRLWPAGNRQPKPPLDRLLPEASLRARVEEYLEQSNALEKLWGRPLATEQLQAEMDRMVADTRDAQVLQELFDALGKDAFVIAETLARQALAERLIRNAYASDEAERSFDRFWAEEHTRFGMALEEASGPFTLASPAVVGCANDTWSRTRVEAPDPRDYHTALWTGAEMIVWGGYNGRSVFNTGSRYNPSTDTWVATATGKDVPSARQFHTAVWTGTEMIVWGGSGGTSQNSGGRYDPLTDTWAPTATGANLPAARVFHTAVWTGTEMIVWGGRDAGSYFRTGGRYDPATNTWAATSTPAAAPVARELHTAVWTGSEMIVWGGSSGGGSFNTGGRYDPSTDAWITTSVGTNVPAARSYHTVVWTGAEMIVWGGTNGNALQSGGRYDPATNAWGGTSLGNAPETRFHHTAIWTGTEMVVWGGSNGSAHLFTGGIYAPSTNTWSGASIGKGLPALRSRHTAVWTGREMVVWGGYNGRFLQTGGRYDRFTDSWMPTSSGASVPSARTYHTSVWTGTEMIVWGGDSGTVLNTGSRYRPSTDTWAATATIGSVPAPRGLHTAVWTGTEMIVWGGWGGVYLSTGGRYDPATNTWAAISTGANVPTARFHHTAVWDAVDGLMIVWGGDDGVSYLATGGRYSPATDTWAATSSVSVPAARSDHSAVWAGTEMIVWGGANASSILRSGGRYRPSTDTWLATSLGPSVPVPRYDHTAAWTGTEMIVWGGSDGSAYLNTGGRYNPATNAWAPTSTGTNVPSARELHAAVWTGTGMIVWGGQGNFPYQVNTGARYDPTTGVWTPTSTLGDAPAPRALHTAVWTGREMIVWGGSSSGGDLSSGGRYCVCLTPPTYYHDADGDGYGISTDTVVSCAPPSGYVEIAGDCDDADASTHPGAPEVKDGKDNQCPGDCPDAQQDCGFGVADEISGPTFWNGSTFCWPVQPGATLYQVVRATAATFAGGCFTFPTTAGTCVDDPARPERGAGYSYLVRSQAPGASGSFGQISGGGERSGGCLPP